MANSSATTTVSGGIGFTGLLTVAFIVLKLTGHISWSWVWVLAPLWIPLLVGLVIFSVVLIILVIAAGWEGYKKGPK